MESQIEYASKMYPTKSGEQLTSEQMAETLTEAIEHFNNQMQSTREARKKKRLLEKLRNIKIWVAQHPDVKQYMQ